MKFKLSSPTYDKLKWIAQYLLPATGTLYYTISQIIPLPAAEEVVGIITALDTFLGTILGISTSQYKKELESCKPPADML
jgi:hypothetical protein